MEKNLLPPLNHICYVVKDFDKAIAHFTKLGFGPFQVSETARTGALIHGKPGDYKLKMARGHLGSLEFEIEEVTGGKPIQAEFLEEHGEGIQHLGFVVDDLDAEVAKWKERGFEVTQHSPPGFPVRFAFIDAGKLGGVDFELVQFPERGKRSTRD